MFEPSTPVRFFLGANTPGGFVGYLTDLYDAKDGWRAYIIKSGPGTGKSSLMRAVLHAMTARGIETEAIHCSSDPQSLDGVIVHALKLCIVDGTAPHILEPQYWGAVERLVNLSVCMDVEALHEQAPAIVAATDICTELHARVRQYIGGAASLLMENRNIAMRCTDTAKVTATAARIAARELIGSAKGNGKERRRFLSAVTPEGLIVFHESLQALCPRIYAIEDEYGYASQVILTELRARARENGMEMISCACPLHPADKWEHLLFPRVGVGFTTSNSFHKADFPVYRRIHAARFMDNEKWRQKRQILSFNRRGAKELLNGATEWAVQAKTAHDRMEVFQVHAMDWAAAEAIAHRVVAEWIAFADSV